MTLPDSLKDRVLDAARRVPSPPRSRRTPPVRTAVAAAALAMLGVLVLSGGPAPGDSMTLPDTLKDRVLDAARRVPSPPRPGRSPPVRTAVAAAALAMLGVLVLSGGPGHAAGRPTSIGASVVMGLAVLAATVTWLVVPPRRSMLPPPTSRLLAVVGGVPLVVAAWLLGWHAAYDDPFTRAGLKCFALTVAAAPWPFAALLLAVPRLAPNRPWLVGGALGAVAGAWAAVVVELWCPLADPGHVAIGHALPLAALVAIGALVGGRWFRLRRT